MSRIAIFTDAEPPQINGVVTTLWKTKEGLERIGHQVEMITSDPNRFKCSLPSYSEIKVQPFAKKYVAQRLENFKPEFIHIATEGSLGLAARNICVHTARPFTTAFHTEYAGYVSIRAKKGLKYVGFSQSLSDKFSRAASTITWRYLQWFHAPSSAIMVASPDVQKQLRKKGFRRIVSWSRGVDTDQFQPYGKNLIAYENLPRPISVYMGRVAAEKNIEAFLNLNLPGSKVVVGEGPILRDLRKQFPNVLYTGAKQGEELGRYVAASDLFVFPSKTDTFGLVIPEALACGIPVVAIPEGGPKDILAPEICRTFSCLSHDLQQGTMRLIKKIETGQVNTTSAREYVSEKYSWKAAIDQFYSNLQTNTPIARRRTKRLGRAAATILHPLRNLRWNRKSQILRL